MTEIKISNNIPNLRKEIEQIQSELTSMGNVVSNIPELITSSNLLRTNESLVKSDQKKTDLISLYAQYSSSMEAMLSATPAAMAAAVDGSATQSAAAAP